jgi:tRNA pseudouridine38-40 synthase
MTSTAPRQLKLLIEYDGTEFSGWQVQLRVRTVQGVIETALAEIFGEKITLYGSGRTDAGVHARGQIAHIYTNNHKLQCEHIRMGVNSLTGRDVNIRAVTEVEEPFHARFSALSRIYKYTILNRPNPLLLRYVWWANREWDDQEISHAATLLIGEHSFKSFCRERPDEKDYICKVYKAMWYSNPDGAVLEIEANRYFHQMVRGIVGALIDVGRGHVSMQKFTELIENPKDNAQVFFAPASGLVLERVNY